MRIGINKYSEILYEALEKESEENYDTVILNFVKLMAKNNHLRYSPRVIAGFKRLCDKKDGVLEIEVTSKSELNEETIDEIKKFFKEKKKANKVEIINTIDTKMIGSMVIKTLDEMIDASVDAQLKKMATQLK